MTPSASYEVHVLLGPQWSIHFTIINHNGIICSCANLYVRVRDAKTSCILQYILGLACSARLVEVNEEAGSVFK